jgi:hypothetical protein
MKILLKTVLSVVKTLSGIKIMFAGLVDHLIEENLIEIKA